MRRFGARCDRDFGSAVVLPACTLSMAVQLCFTTLDEVFAQLRDGQMSARSVRARRAEGWAAGRGLRGASQQVAARRPVVAEARRRDPEHGATWPGLAGRYESDGSRLGLGAESGTPPRRTPLRALSEPDASPSRPRRPDINSRSRTAPLRPFPRRAGHLLPTQQVHVSHGHPARPSRSSAWRAVA